MKPVAIINLAKEEWANPRRARKQLLFEALLKQPLVEEVLYVDPPRHKWQPYSETTCSSSGLRVWQEEFPLPGERFSWVRNINRWYIYYRLNKQLANRPIWHTFYYHPFDVPLARKLLRHGPVFFDWTEDWAVYHNKPALRTEQDAAINIASGVIVVTESLGNRVRKLCGDKKKILFLPNATAWKPLQHLQCPEDMAHIPSPRIGYIGHLGGTWFDEELVVKLSYARPDWHWIMIGYAEQRIHNYFRDCPNVHLFGQRPFNELQNYMAQCQVLVAPYIENSSGDSSKLYDYLTLGLPIVSSEIETANRLQPHIRIASGMQSWLYAIDGALNESNVSLRQARQEASLEHTWDARAVVLLAWLREFANA